MVDKEKEMVECELRRYECVCVYLCVCVCVRARERDRDRETRKGRNVKNIVEIHRYRKQNCLSAKRKTTTTFNRNYRNYRMYLV